MSFLSYVSRINIEIGRSFIHRSFPRRVEYPYLSEWGRQAWNKKNPLPSWQSFFLPPSSLFIPISPFEFLLLSRSCYVSLSHFRRGASRGIYALLFRAFLFVAFTPNPCLFTPGCCYLLLRSFLVFHRCADGVRFFLGGARLTIGQGANSSTFQPFRIQVTPRSVGWTWVIVSLLSIDYSYFAYL